MEWRQALTIALVLTCLDGLSLMAQEQDELTDELAATLSLQHDEIEDEFEFLEEQQVVYSAAKHSQDISDSPSAITVITRTQIENTYCMDVACLLSQVPEVEVFDFTPLSILVGARALASSGDRALVLIDGREINVEWIGVPFFQGLPIHLEDIERIEVIRGPGSALYGPNAHSMVVSIFTRRIERSGGEVFLGAGEHDSSSIDAKYRQILGTWTLQVSGGYQTLGNWRIRDRRENEVLRSRLLLSHDHETSHTFFEAGAVSFEGVMYTVAAPIATKHGLSGYALAVHQRDFFKAQLAVDLFSLDFSLDLPLIYKGQKMGELPAWMNMISFTVNPQAEFSFHPISSNLLVSGLEYRLIYFITDHNDPSSIFQHRLGAFLHDEQRIGEQLLMTGGVRFDYNSISPFAFSPQLALAWKFQRDHSLRMAFSQAFRKPNFFNTTMHPTGIKAEPGFPEIGDFFTKGIGNPDLDNEAITVLETGYIGRFFNSHLIAEADVFYNQYRKTIHIAMNLKTNALGMPDLSASSVQYSNTGMDLDSIGGSISFTYRPTETWRFALNYTYRYNWFVSEPYGEAYQLGVRKGRQSPWEPAHLFYLSLGYTPPGGLRFGLSMNGSSESHTGLPRDGNFFYPTELRDLPASMVINGYLSWRMNLGSSWFELGVRTFNLANAGIRAKSAVSRPDGTELGGELLGRRIFLYLKGVL